MKSYDLAIIGAGPAGYAAAMRAMDFGLKTVLINKGRLGGAGIFDGALSSKTLWELSENYLTTRSSNFAYRVFDSELEYQDVISEVNKAVTVRHQQLYQQIDFYRKKGILRYIKGWAKLSDKNTIEVETGDYEIETIKAKDIILAIGTKPRKIASIPIDEENILTSDGISNLKNFPASMVILGAGVIGCEFATIFSNFGKTRVHLIDKEERILPFEDEDLSNTVAKNLEDNGCHVHRNSRLLSMKLNEDKHVVYELEYKDGTKEIHTVEKALVAVGRSSQPQGMGLEKIGIELTDRNQCVDNDTCTTVDNIYAVGDFTADISLVNIGVQEGRYCVEKICEYDDPSQLSYDNISWIMFLNPEVAAVGKNEKQCRKEGIPYRVAKMSFTFLNRAIAMRRTQGFFKLIVTDDDEMRILGTRVLGNHASSTIESVALMIKLGKGIRELSNIMTPHPSIPEGLQECVRMLLGSPMLKPQIFTQHLQCYRVSGEGEVERMKHGNGSF
ncbi:MAG: dihydrolipoyl dehydrogenase [Candidatus Kapaibacteriales bacterium]